MIKNINTKMHNEANFVKGNIEKKVTPDVNVPQDKIEIGKESGLIAKSRKGWELLGDRLYNSKIVQGHHKVKSGISKILKYPFKGIIRKIEELAGDDDDKKECEAIKKESKENLDRFADSLKDFPSSRHGIDASEKEQGNYSDDSFWERHPILRSFFLGYKGLKKMPKLLLKIPRMLFRVVFPAAYGQTGKQKMVGMNVVNKLISGIRNKPWYKKGMEYYSKLMNVPGVALAMSILGPVFGLSRMAEGLMEYKEGVHENNHYQMLDGKVEMMTGALATVKPLVLLAIVTEGVHIFLNYRIKKKGMDPAKADRIMTNVFAAATAPIGLAAYALLAPPTEKSTLARKNLKKHNGD